MCHHPARQRFFSGETQCGKDNRNGLSGRWHWSPQQKLVDAPDMIGQPRGHRRRAYFETLTLESLACQCLMRPHPVIERQEPRQPMIEGGDAPRHRPGSAM